MGEKTTYGVMPDWNPAEIIGLKPMPLSISIIQRTNYRSLFGLTRDIIMGIETLEASL